MSRDEEPPVSLLESVLYMDEARGAEPQWRPEVARPGMMPTPGMGGGGDDDGPERYRGYLVTKSARGGYHVSRNGRYVGTHDSPAEARAAIDALVGESAPAGLLDLRLERACP
jgi:hypothetical protein